MEADRNLSPNTQKSYRDTIRLLFGYIAEHHGTDAVRVTVEQIDATVARDFLAHLEHVRGNATSTRNLRLTALHSLFRFIARQAPELVEHAATIHAIPPRRTAVPAMAYLEKHEIDAMLSVPRGDPCRPAALVFQQSGRATYEGVPLPARDSVGRGPFAG